MSEQTTAATKLDADQIKERKYFSPSELESGVSYLSLLMGSIEDVEYFYNFDPNNIPEDTGNGLLVIPMQKRSEDAGPMTVTGFITALVPPMEVVLSDPKGAAALQESYFDLLARKMRGVINSTDDGTPIKLPDTLAGFFERASRGEGLQAFLAIAKTAVKQLKDQGFKKLDVNTLRNIFMSAAFASHRYPKIPQEIWLAVMNKMKDTAKAAGLDTSIYDTWVENRNETTMDEDIDTLDLSALGLSADGSK